MEYCYRKEPNHNYLVIRGEEGIEVKNYRLKILENNEIECFLKMKVSYINNITNYEYEVSSKQSIKEMYSCKKMTYDELIEIINGLKDVMRISEEYLLHTDKILLQPEYIYVNPANLKPYFCYCPESKGDVAENIRELFQYFLDAIDHCDKKAVAYVYDIYCNSRKNNFVLEEITTVKENLCETVNEKEKVHQGEKVSDREQKNNKEEYIFVVAGLAGMIIIFMKMYIVGIGIILAAAVGAFIILRKNKNESDNICKKEKNIEVDEVEISKDEDYDENTILMAVNKKAVHELISTDAGESIPVSYYPFVIGSLKQKNDLSPVSDMVSRIHARFIEEDEIVYIEDMNSKNGTYINGIQVLPYEKKKILEGDKIRFADVTYIFQ